MNTDKHDFLTLAEAASRFGISYAKAHTWHAQGRLGSLAIYKKLGRGRPPVAYPAQRYQEIIDAEDGTERLKRCENTGHFLWTLEDIAEACGEETEDLLKQKDFPALDHPGGWYATTWMPWAISQGILTG